MEVMGLMLGEFVDDYTVRVIDVFAMPQSGTVSLQLSTPFLTCYASFSDYKSKSVTTMHKCYSISERDYQLKCNCYTQ